MLLSQHEDPMFLEVEKLISSLGLHLIDLSTRKKDGMVKVGIILWGNSGIGVDECAKVHRLVLPRMELAYGQDNVAMEVSSPGLERNFKYVKELEIFLGKRVKVLMEGASEWLSGSNEKIADGILFLRSETALLELSIAKISKAKLNEI